jgi:hypothetical protein
VRADCDRSSCRCGDVSMMQMLLVKHVLQLLLLLLLLLVWC